MTISLDKCDHETAWNLELNYTKKMWELTKADSVEVVEATLSEALSESSAASTSRSSLRILRSMRVLIMLNLIPRSIGMRRIRC